jgi:hypothetical protein
VRKTPTVRANLYELADERRIPEEVLKRLEPSSAEPAIEASGDTLEQRVASLERERDRDRGLIAALERMLAALENK